MKQLDALLTGNRRFASGQSIHPNQNLDRIKAVAGKQKPLAAILSCSDSRVPPEIIFDQGIGDLFVVRTAGCVAKNIELASVEYAVNHLNAPLLLVLGHKRCGAVAACLQNHSAGQEHYLPELVARIKENIGPQGSDPAEATLDRATRANIKKITEDLGREDFIAEKVKEGSLAVAAAYYDLDNGRVELI